MFSCLHVGRVIRILNPNPHLWTFSMPRFFSHCLLFLQASTPYSLESESLRMDCIMSGGASPTLAINAVTNKVGHQLFISCFNTKQRRHTKFMWPDAWLPSSVRYRQRLVRHLATLLLERAFLPFWQIQQIQIGIQSQQSQHHNKETANSQKEK